jgi:hypothetical protein
MTGKCALCGTNASLIDSHFMPASLYQELLDPNGPIKQMIVLKKDKTHQSSEQFSMPLLCQPCEVRFQQGGENWTLGSRYRSDGSFPLRDMLLRATPIETKPENSRVYAARQVPGIDVEQLIYFAASLFWRAGVADWKVKFAEAPKIDLDASLMMALQQYLLGMSPFPSRASIFVSVDDMAAPWRAMWSPMKRNGRPQLRYSLYIPGIIMELGVDLHPALRIPSISDIAEVIVLSDVVYKYVASIGSALAEGSELSKSLARHFPSGRS